MSETLSKIISTFENYGAEVEDAFEKEERIMLEIGFDDVQSRIAAKERVYGIVNSYNVRNYKDRAYIDGTIKFKKDRLGSIVTVELKKVGEAKVTDHCMIELADGKFAKYRPGAFLYPDYMPSQIYTADQVYDYFVADARKVNAKDIPEEERKIILDYIGCDKQLYTDDYSLSKDDPREKYYTLPDNPTTEEKYKFLVERDGHFKPVEDPTFNFKNY